MSNTDWLRAPAPAPQGRSATWPIRRNIRPGAPLWVRRQQVRVVSLELNSEGNYEQRSALVDVER